MRTNNKKHPVYQYIIDSIDLSERDGLTGNDLADVYEIFRQEKSREIIMHGEYESFKSWLQGVCGTLSIDHGRWERVQLGKAWGMLPEDATEKQIGRFTENWYDFITQKSFDLFRRNNINI